MPKQCFGSRPFFAHTSFTPMTPQSVPGRAHKHDTSRSPHLTWGQHFSEQPKSTPQNNPGISPSLPAGSTKSVQAVRQPACCTPSPIQGKGKGVSLLGEIKCEIATRSLRRSCDNIEQEPTKCATESCHQPSAKLTLRPQQRIILCSGIVMGLYPWKEHQHHLSTAPPANSSAFFHQQTTKVTITFWVVKPLPTISCSLILTQQKTWIPRTVQRIWD